MNNRLVQKSKRLLSGIVVAAIATSMLPTLPAVAETGEKYPYTLFAGSSTEGAITVNSGNFCINGNVATNGTIVSSGNMNVNGTKTENAGFDMIYIFDKIDTKYFSGNNVEEHTEDYFLDELNININTPTEVLGEAELTGNININTALKAFEDVTLNGEVKNTNDSVIYSKYGDIVIDSTNVNLNGLVYAPFGSVEVKAMNLNLNNVVIIADSIVLDCPNVNANYSTNAAEFVGTVSEPLDIPVDEWQYMTNENGNGLPDFIENTRNWSKLIDTDGDKLPDCIEQYIGSDAMLPDTDGDGLDDCYEAFVLYTSPTKTDTDENGITDCDEDFDEDGLTNRKEYICDTSPWMNDTDDDNLTDGEEINTYGTNPLEPDTDFDGLEDSDEIYLGTDPTITDTDGDGILDCDEKFYQTFTHIVENEECAIEEVIVSMEGTGNLQTNTTIESVMDKDVICSEVVGLIGEPFSIETTSRFDTATLTFKINQSKLGDTAFDNLMFLWYDEENYKFVELETFYDYENSTVSIETTHFSKYMVIDKYKWFEAWAVEFDYNPTGGASGAPTIPVKYNTVLAIDCSGSMDWNDPISIRSGINSAYDALHPYTCNRITAAEGFIKYMNSNDETAIVLFTDSANTASSMTTDKETLKLALQKMYSNGGTSFSAALNASIKQIESAEKISNGANKNRIILLSDGDDNDSSSRRNAAIQMCNDKYIEVYTVGFGSANDTILQNIADKTGGKYYKALNAQDIVDIFAKLGYMDDFDMTDTDGDGLPDAVEAAGIRIQNGKIIYGCDPTNPDSDNDGLLDGEEINPSPIYSEKEDNGWFGLKELFGTNTVQGYYFDMYSNPEKEDSDGDGLFDGKAQYHNGKALAPTDPDPINVTGEFNMWKTHIEEIKSETKTAYGYSNDYYEPVQFEGEVKWNFIFPYLDSNLVEVIVSAFSSFGSVALDFRYDDEHIALHSDTTQWQSIGGYNDFYDWVFNIATSMNKLKLDFTLSTNNQDYVVWVWKGNYLNLGAGSEVGFYTQNETLENLEKNFKLEHWMVSDELPMTLSLYKVAGNGLIYDTYYHWLPDENQWWITGFVPDVYDQWLSSKFGLDWGDTVTEDKLLQIASVDFSENPQMLIDLKKNFEGKREAQYLIFDMEENTLWIAW